MQSQLERMLSGTGVAFEVRDRDAVRPDAEFEGLVVFHLRGNCSMDALPVGALSDERGPLAMAYSEAGMILPFGEVECDRIRTSLERVLGRQNGRTYQPVFDAALGMVLAHELYHMLAKTSGHTRSGFTKESLSAHELAGERLSLPEIAQLAIRQNLWEARGR